MSETHCYATAACKIGLSHFCEHSSVFDWSQISGLTDLGSPVFGPRDTFPANLLEVDVCRSTLTRPTVAMISFSLSHRLSFMCYCLGNHPDFDESI